VVDLSSSFDEGDLIADVSWYEEFTRRLFDNLNRDVLGPPGDGKITILSDSDEEEEEEEEEVREEKAVDAEATPSSVVRSPASTASAADVDGTYKCNTLDRATCGCSNDGDEADLP
jgi:hypothetical protein